MVVSGFGGIRVTLCPGLATVSDLVLASDRTQFASFMTSSNHPIVERMVLSNVAHCVVQSRAVKAPNSHVLLHLRSLGLPDIVRPMLLGLVLPCQPASHSRTHAGNGVTTNTSPV